jgi:ABC-type glycerol-3-phosphate transport system substrate-binding protein
MKLKLKSALKPFAALTALSLLAAGCGGGGTAAKPAQLLVWKVFEDTTHFQPLLRAYQKAHPNVRVTFVEKVGRVSTKFIVYQTQ